jgi:hypothetical protein
MVTVSDATARTTQDVTSRDQIRQTAIVSYPNVPRFCRPPSRRLQRRNRRPLLRLPSSPRRRRSVAAGDRGASPPPLGEKPDCPDQEAVPEWLPCEEPVRPLCHRLFVGGGSGRGQLSLCSVRDCGRGSPPDHRPAGAASDRVEPQCRLGIPGGRGGGDRGFHHLPSRQCHDGQGLQWWEPSPCSGLLRVLEAMDQGSPWPGSSASVLHPGGAPRHSGARVEQSYNAAAPGKALRGKAGPCRLPPFGLVLATYPGTPILGRGCLEVTCNRGTVQNSIPFLNTVVEVLSMSVVSNLRRTFRNQRLKIDLKSR